jgi:hypothetical protein
MGPEMHRFLLEAAELMHQGNLSLDRLMTYLKNNLNTLFSQLSEENFKRTLAVVWERLTTQLHELIDSSIEVKQFKDTLY